MLPFEVPATFSNRHFYAFLKRHEIEVRGKRLYWTGSTAALDPVIRLFFGVRAAATPVAASIVEWGRTRSVRSFALNECQIDTIPFQFRVSHKTGSRCLSVPHPRNQVMVADFYRQNYASILHYCSGSSFSIRHPVSVSKYSYFKDWTHQVARADAGGSVEEVRSEYEQIGSYFVYRAYSNIHKFFESYKYHRSEKKFNAMMQVDISKCFDSIYTHSIAWAILGKSQTKRNLIKSKGTFPDNFDRLMQLMNERETNGILIGPEFSRVFAEIILQSVDIEIERAMDASGLKHKVDYEVFRYVDDYFIFFNQREVADNFIDVASSCLSEYKLHINSLKSKVYEKPVITELTIAKDRVSGLLGGDEWSRKSLREAAAPVAGVEGAGLTVYDFSGRVDANRLIVKFKTIIKETGVGYADILNYTLAVVESKLGRTFDQYEKCERTDEAERQLTNIAAGILEFVFFAYAASPKVNHTVRVVRIIARLTDFFNRLRVSYERKHAVYKFIHDNIVHQLEKNRVEKFREVENLYLLNALSQIGKAYWLPQSTLSEYFGIVRDGAGKFSRDQRLSYFSITVGLCYMRDKERYNELRQFFEDHAVEKLTHLRNLSGSSAEALLLLLDIVACPYVSPATTFRAGLTFGLGATEIAAIRAAGEQWFTTWSGFNLVAELDAKRARDVY
jgi:hypothetical protein